MSYGGYNYYDSYSSGISSGVLTTIGVLLAIAATIVLLILVVPEKRREKLPKFFQTIHDICNFKGLLIEKILKVLYVYSTVNIMFMGILTWFSKGSFGKNFLIGLIMLIVGPIAVRLVYEILMLAVLIVKNVIQINNKLSGKTDDPFSNKTDAFSSFKSNNQKQTTFQQSAPQGQNVVQPQKQTPQQNYTAPTDSKFCINCGKPINGNISVCPHCGFKRM